MVVDGGFGIGFGIGVWWWVFERFAWGIGGLGMLEEGKRVVLYLAVVLC